VFGIFTAEIMQYLPHELVVFRPITIYSGESIARCPYVVKLHSEQSIGVREGDHCWIERVFEN
jgi:hypothetical protein